jgi:hypothetical protein
MRNHRRAWAGRIALAVMSMCAVSAAGQEPGKLAGHWEGSIQVPGEPLAIAIDLFAAPDDKWDGTIAIAAQNIKGLPLTNVTFKGTVVEFGLPGVPGEPKFTGTLSPDGKVLSGDYSQGGATLPFTLAWKREATREVIPPSTPITTDFEGTWEGALAVGGQTLRLVLTLSSAEGRAIGSLVSVDQGGVAIPVASVQQNASHLKLDIRAIVASYDGDLKDGQIAGTWVQGPNSLPLVFKRSAAPQK